MANSGRIATFDEVRVEAALRSVDIVQLAAWMWRLERGERNREPAGGGTIVAAELGWVEMGGTNPRLTESGLVAVQSLREYLLWEQRGRRLHGQGTIAGLDVALFRGQRVLEIGCGCGVNLWSIQSQARTVLGLDIEPGFLSLGRVLARIAGVPVPEMRAGRGEATGLPTGGFDWVVMYGALQYMEIEAVLREAARLVAPGGGVLCVLGELADFAEHWVRSEGWRLLHPRRLGRVLRHVIGAATYPWIGRKLLRNGSPVHPTAHRMRTWLARAGLEYDARLSGKVAGEMCYVGRRREGGLAGEA